MNTPFFRALLIAGFALAFLAFTGCESETAVEETDETVIETEVEMEPADELDSLGNVIEEAAGDAAAAAGEAADVVEEAAGDAADAAGDAVDDATDGQ